MRLPPPILALSPGTLAACDAGSFVARVARCRERGLRGLVLREQQLCDRDYLALASALRDALPLEIDGWLALHGRPHLARAARADAVHLGGRSLAPLRVREWLDGEIALGLSTHATEETQSWSGADYLVHGPVCATTKGETRVVGIGFAALARGVARARVSVWALGGLGPEHAAQAAQSGASGMAVLGGLLAHPQAEDRTEQYVRAWLERAPKA
ncbi:MAG: thiamine phosphate synthase [Planctomycetes bacterium]|nr:thiamine phosphate synthase [Planctomycetota bacterium]